MLPNRLLIEQASRAVAALLRFARPADAELSAFFRAGRQGPRERAFIAETAYAVLRRLRSLSAWCGEERPEPRQLTLAALVRERGLSVSALAPFLTAAELAWLASRRATPAAVLDPAVRLDLPDWLYQRWQECFGEEGLEALARALNCPAPLDLRVNPLRATRDEVLERLQQEGIAAAPCPYAPWGVRLRTKPALEKHSLFLSGAVEAQDEGSQLIVHLVAPRRGEMVVDFCAGAGGKTLALGALMRGTGRVYAFDVSARRLAQLKPRLARSGLANVFPVAIASENDGHVKRLAGKIDRVLVDAPCSGLGTLRRNPDLKWRRRPEEIHALAAKQRAILAAAARLVKPGGRLVYATCSLLPEENQEVVTAFLAAHRDFARLDAASVLAASGIDLPTRGEDLVLLPSQHGCDGFYGAVLERRRG